MMETTGVVWAPLLIVAVAFGLLFFSGQWKWLGAGLLLFGLLGALFWGVSARAPVAIEEAQPPLMEKQAVPMPR